MNIERFVVDDEIEQCFAVPPHNQAMALRSRGCRDRERSAVGACAVIERFQCKCHVQRIVRADVEGNEFTCRGQAVDRCKRQHGQRVRLA
ncbi:hypothetical protein LGN44_27470 [Burkholderia cepacia]|nr:hypothetical protein [Burkholderia cepacia]MCA8345244.1 hypothetical protein [Burkholderia cepacia]MDO5947376.1 hypothetical protein [Burkholderia cepacia]